MRTISKLFGVFAIVFAVGALSGCSLFHGDYPDTKCNTDVDCFRAQGETCNLATNTCEVLPDAAPLPDAPPRPDAMPAPDADMTPDAMPGPDAEPADAGVDAT